MTKISLDIVTAWSLKNEWSDIAEKIPLTRTGTPEDVAGTALFLASRAGAYVNGTPISIPIPVVSSEQACGYQLLRLPSTAV